MKGKTIESQIRDDVHVDRPIKQVSDHSKTHPNQVHPRHHSKSNPTHLPARRIRRNRRDILNPSDPHSSPSQCSQSTLSSRSGRLGSSTSSCTDLDVQCGDTNLAATNGDVLSCEHGGVGRGLVAVCFDLHPAGDSGYRLLAREICDVDKSVVEARKYMGDAKDEFSFFDLRSKRRGLSVVSTRS